MKKYITQLFIICALLSIVGCGRKWDNPVDPRVPLEVPELIAPNNNATDISIYPLLKWHAVEGATGYTLQVSNNSSFTSYIYNKGDLIDTSQRITKLEYITTYYWRVNATKNGTTYGWSNIGAFTTIVKKDIEWISIPAGNFTMGVTAADTQNLYGYWWADELPQHTVYIDAFQMSKNEITNVQYKAFIDSGGYSNSTYWTTEGWAWKTTNNISEPVNWTNGDYNCGLDFPNHPITTVTWYEAYAFCKWAGGRLPTEAEWEKAARGTDARFYPWGNSIDSTKCNSHCGLLPWYPIFPPDTFAYSAPIGAFVNGQSPFGVYDMAGNVWEWVNDWYQFDYYSVSPSINPQGPTSGSGYVIRGGGWGSNYVEYRVTFRFCLIPIASYSYSVGFRAAK